MGYLPQFDHDIFVSYRRTSNKEHDRWVDAFCTELHARLADLVGEVKFWRDTTDLRAGDQWRPEIGRALESAAIFLAIISRTYFDSDVCRSELDQFLGRVKATGDAAPRIVPILKHPTRPDELPQELAAIDHHAFFQFDPPGSRYFREFSPGKGEMTAPQFWQTLEQVAQQLMDLLDELRRVGRKKTIGTVYVASVPPELQAERAQLRSDLQQRGYRVVPEREYLWNASDFRQKIAADFDQADLCVHQVSRIASIDPHAAERARLQLDLALEAMARRGKPAPLVWIQSSDRTEGDAKLLVDYIERDLANQGLEYSRGSLEDFKTQVYDLLRPATVRSERPSRDVALLVEEGDLASTGELVALLVDRLGVDPRRIELAGSSPKDSSAMEAALAGCGACLLFWGTQSEDWVRNVLALPGLARRFGRDRTCVYAAPPASAQKATFRSTRARTVPASASAEGDLAECLGAAGADR